MASGAPILWICPRCCASYTQHDIPPPPLCICGTAIIVSANSKGSRLLECVRCGRTVQPVTQRVGRKCICGGDLKPKVKEPRK